jgi:hypothetical protein
MRNRDVALQTLEQLTNLVHSLERSIGPTMEDTTIRQSLLYGPIEVIKERLEFVHSLVDREPETF